MYELSDDERKQWDVDPDEWPHTPPFRIFAALMEEDDNVWWRAGSGHGLNAYEAAVTKVEELRERLEALADEWDALPYHKRTTAELRAIAAGEEYP